MARSCCCCSPLLRCCRRIAAAAFAAAAPSSNVHHHHGAFAVLSRHRRRSQGSVRGALPERHSAHTAAPRHSANCALRVRLGAQRVLLLDVVRRCALGAGGAPPVDGLLPLLVRAAGRVVCRRAFCRPSDRRRSGSGARAGAEGRRPGTTGWFLIFERALIFHRRDATSSAGRTGPIHAVTPDLRREMRSRAKDFHKVRTPAVAVAVANDVAVAVANDVAR